jgi:hypothetical protein
MYIYAEGNVKLLSFVALTFRIIPFWGLICNSKFFYFTRVVTSAQEGRLKNREPLKEG